MPIYEYLDKLTGELVELSKPIRLRDDCAPNLQRVMSRPARARIGAGVADPSHADQAVPRALKEEEQRIGTSELERLSGFSAKQMKRIWKIK